MLFALTPADLGVDAVTSDPLDAALRHSLFVEGSGTQIYSTSFVQWAARETLRRAQPEQLLVRFAPRQRQRTLNQFFDAATNVEVPDPEGSFRDADISAYYILLDMLRIADPGAHHVSGLAGESRPRSHHLAPRPRRKNRRRISRSERRVAKYA